MCGIWSFITRHKEYLCQNKEIINQKFNSIKGRGPEYSNLQNINDNILLGFHRLCIVDPSEGGHQPFSILTESRQIFLTCNGEIYNHKQLVENNNLDVTSESDCESILHLYAKFGIEKTIDLLDGVFACTIIDIDLLKGTGKVISFRDRIGVRPLFMGTTDNKSYCFSSEIKGITDLCDNIEVFTPGTIVTLSFSLENYNFKFTKQVYYPYDYENRLNDLQTIKPLIKYQFIDSVKKRLMSDRPLCSLLSGGLDSSLVSAILASISDKPIYTFSIGMEGATDFKYAKIVADKIGSIHKEILFTPEEALMPLNL